jgi:hypothetical protein
LFINWWRLSALTVSAFQQITSDAFRATMTLSGTSSNSPRTPFNNSTLEGTMSNTLVLEVPKYLHAPDWVAFESVLRNLCKLERTPAETLTEGLYGFAALAGAERYTAEELLDEIDMIVSNIRVALQNQRAAQSKL